MAENDIMTKIPAIVVIIGAILAIVAFFIAWVTNPDVTGLDFVTNKEVDGAKVQDVLKSWQIWIPLIALILAVIAAIAAIVTFFLEIPKMYLNIGYIIFGLVIVILAIVFFTTEFSYEGISVLKVSDNAGVGIWLSLAGGVIIALVGALDLAGIFDKLTGGSSAQ